MGWFRNRALRRYVDQATRTGRSIQFTNPSDSWIFPGISQVDLLLHAFSHNILGFVIGIIFGGVVIGFFANNENGLFYEGFITGVGILLLLKIAKLCVRFFKP